MISTVLKHLLGRLVQFWHPPERVCVDSRLIAPGELFFALPGAVHDGHMFLEEAAKKGASGAVIRADYAGPVPHGLSVVRVDDPLRLLQDVAKRLVSASKGKVIAITGSIGKTTTKEFVRTILGLHHTIFATHGNQNSEIGLPLSLINGLKGTEEWLVVEMGMTEAGHIRRLLEIAPPDIALVTAVTLVHAENFQSVQDIARAKAEIFEHPKTLWNLYNGQTGCGDVLSSIGKGIKRTFSVGGKTFWSLEVGGGCITIHEGGQPYQLPCPLFPSPHVYENLIAAIAAARTANVSWEDVEQAMPLLRLPERRIEQKELGGIRFINDSYNACELSTISALGVLAESSSGRRVAVLGQMRELGGFSKACHERVGEVALASSDALYCLGQECEPMVRVWERAGRAVFWTCSFDDLVLKLKTDLQAADVVLLKGSMSNGLWRILDHFVTEKAR